jgi:hypothetical protein
MDMRPCDDHGSGHGAHAKAIKDEIKDKMSASLKRLLKDQDNPGGTFTLDVQKAENERKYYIGYIRGKISGDDNLKELSDILNDFQSKEDCLRVIFFQAAPTTLTDDGPGFEWSACQYPMVVCPNGECCMAVDTNANTNTGSSNTNANANANANANSNVNRP